MFGEPEVTITKCDNGFILEWRKPSNAYTNAVTVTGREPPTQGKEIYNTLKKALNAASDRLT